jgi:hypothetical protein
VGHECFNEDMRGNLESCVMILQGGDSGDKIVGTNV